MAPVTTVELCSTEMGGPGHRVRHQRVWNAELLQLPGSEPRPLQDRPSLADPDARAAPGLVRGTDHAERGAVADAGERAGVVAEAGGFE